MNLNNKEPMENSFETKMKRIKVLLIIYTMMAIVFYSIKGYSLSGTVILASGFLGIGFGYYKLQKENETQK